MIIVMRGFPFPPGNGIGFHGNDHANSNIPVSCQALLMRNVFYFPISSVENKVKAGSAVTRSLF